VDGLAGVLHALRRAEPAPHRCPARHHRAVGPFTAGDGGIVLLAIQNQREWSGLCNEVLELPELVVDPRFRKNSDRVAHRDQLESIISASIRHRTSAEFEVMLETAGIVNARMNTMEQQWAHPMLAERKRWRDVGTPAGAVAALLPPATLDGVQARMDPVPALGEHSAAILAGLGRTPAEIERMRSTSITS